MVNSYDDMQGDPIEPGNHPATNMPQATQHYAGDVVQGPTGGSGSTSTAVDYALGKSRDSKVLPIGNKTLGDWAKRQQR